MACMTVVGIPSAVLIADSNSLTVVTEDGISSSVVPEEASASRMNSNAAKHDVPCPAHTPAVQHNGYLPQT